VVASYRLRRNCGQDGRDERDSGNISRPSYRSGSPMNFPTITFLAAFLVSRPAKQALAFGHERFSLRGLPAGPKGSAGRRCRLVDALGRSPTTRKALGVIAYYRLLLVAEGLDQGLNSPV
jgi:hypothetical protein